MITQDFVDGAKAVVKELDKACKERKKKIDSMYVENSWDAEYKFRCERELEIMVDMKIKAEKTWRRYRHQLEEQNK